MSERIESANSNTPTPSPELPRITWRFLGQQLMQVVNLERGIGFTCWQLLIRPGQAVREYLFVDRRRMVKPITMLVLALSIHYLVAFGILGVDFIPETGFELPPNAAERVQQAVEYAVYAITKYYE